MLSVTQDLIIQCIVVWGWESDTVMNVCMIYCTVPKDTETLPLQSRRGRWDPAVCRRHVRLLTECSWWGRKAKYPQNALGKRNDRGKVVHVWNVIIVGEKIKKGKCTGCFMIERWKNRRDVVVGQIVMNTKPDLYSDLYMCISNCVWRPQRCNGPFSPHIYLLQLRFLFVQLKSLYFSAVNSEIKIFFFTIYIWNNSTATSESKHNIEYFAASTQLFSEGLFLW